jgi:hypothetical protein
MLNLTVRTMSLYASLMAVLGLGSSILAGNEDAFIMRVPLVQQKALLMFASVLAVRALCIRVCDFGIRRSSDKQLVLPSAYRTRSLTRPGERRWPNRPSDSIARVARHRRRTEQGIWSWTESVVT